MKNKFYKMFVFKSLFAATAFNVHASPTLQIVSDYDDTVKIANVNGDSLDKIEKALLSGDFYAGMAKLYDSWTIGAPQKPDPLHFLSGSPTFLEDRIEEFLKQNGFANFRLSLRNWFTQRDTALYKYNVLKSNYLKTTEDLILVGDDTQYDHEVYNRFSKERKIVAIYIRNINQLKLPEGQRAFTSAFDIAAFEALEGRMTDSQALQVADAVLNDKDEKILPEFISCSGVKTSCMTLDLSGQMKLACDKIENRIQSICSKR